MLREKNFHRTGRSVVTPRLVSKTKKLGEKRNREGVLKGC
jgi:hypothetical protein